ncbi:hypothetical protein SDRG_00513 [Saprolegnia diclina VS20]|uniref:Rho-GAP domain-containing protein n=1 Tax=Saprolegnia diclina (strain VS20) TaxID=1156394 RepID=T0SIL9_SAPDV|nr:hypothetical protein SDRG_00513 [Saprolegnia diclina VS20]EQC42792.1 hypothetical protein SDRG_00513 [Saprolegnia diclina VS20]|eukprot:XP_008604215.1 hypothetical protein SDRG_00513 [Saprolegnia diclina VS20]
MASTWRKVLRQTSVLLSPTRPSLRQIHEPLPKIPVRVSWLLIELITYVDTHCTINETLYREQGRSTDASELLELVQHHASNTSAPISERLSAFSSAVLTTVIVQILHTYEPLLSYTVSQELLERGRTSTIEAIATALPKVRSTSRQVLRVLLGHLAHVASCLDVRKPVKHLSRLVGLHVVRPSEDPVSLNQRDAVKARIVLSNALIAGAASWPYDCQASMPTAKELLFLLKLQWPEDAIASEDHLLRCLNKYGAVESIECDLGSFKAKVCLRLRSSKPLNRTVLKLHAKARIYVVYAALQHEGDASPELRLSQGITETLRLLDDILADAPSNAFETHKLHESHVHAMTKVLEAEVRASQELLRLHKAQYDAQAKHWEVELTTAKLLRLEAEKLNTDLRQELHSTRSELACHLAMLSHLRRDSATLHERAVVAEAQTETLTREKSELEAQVLSLKDVAAKAQIRVESYKHQVSNQEDEPTDVKPPARSTDALANVKGEMSRQLQRQIDTARAAIAAMAAKDPATQHLSHQEETLSMLLGQLEQTQVAQEAGADAALSGARRKLQQLYTPPVDLGEDRVDAWTLELRRTLATAQRGVGRPASNADSLNAAKESLRRFQATLHRVGP